MDHWPTSCQAGRQQPRESLLSWSERLSSSSEDPRASTSSSFRHSSSFVFDHILLHDRRSAPSSSSTSFLRNEDRGELILHIIDSALSLINADDFGLDASMTPTDLMAEDEGADKQEGEERSHHSVATFKKNPSCHHHAGTEKIRSNVGGTAAFGQEDHDILGTATNRNTNKRKKDDSCLRQIDPSLSRPMRTGENATKVIRSSTTNVLPELEKKKGTTRSHSPESKKKEILHQQPPST